MTADSKSGDTTPLVASELGISSDAPGVAIRGGAIRVVGYTAGVLLSLGAAAILLRHLGIATFGRYVTVTSLVGIVGGVTEAGIVVYGIREFVARTEPDRRLLLTNLLWLRLALTAGGMICAVCFGVAVGYEPVIVLGTLIAGAGLLLLVTSDVLSVALQAQLQLGRLTLVDIVRRAVTLLLVGLLALAGAALLPFFAASTFAAAVAVMLLAWMVRSHFRIQLSFDRAVWSALFRETTAYAVALSIAVVYLYITVVVMSLVASPTQTGLFATSFRVTQVVLTIPSLLLTAVFPLMSRTQHRTPVIQAGITGKVQLVAVICGAWLSMSLALGADFIVRVIAGNHARAAIPVLKIQALVILVSFLSTANALSLVSLRRYWPLVVSSSCALVLNVVIAIILVESLGAEGGALADVIAETVVAIGLTVTVARSLPLRTMPASFLLPVALAAALSAALLQAPIPSLARAGLATAVYFGALSACGRMPPELLAAAGRLPGGRFLARARAVTR